MSIKVLKSEIAVLNKIIGQYTNKYQVHYAVSGHRVLELCRMDETGKNVVSTHTLAYGTPSKLIDMIDFYKSFSYQLELIQKGDKN